MAKIIPFKAVRPTRENASLVTARSYDDYSPAELAAQLEFNPLSFLHVVNPAYANAQKYDFQKRFRLVHRKYQEFKDEEILIEDEKPSFYIHQMISKKQLFTGIIAGTSIADYKSDVIKKHENTLHYRVEMFKEYMKYSGFNVEPVLMTYPDNDLLAEWIVSKTAAPAATEFTTTSKHTHYLWKIDDDADIAFLQNAFSKMPNLYIADGHHRSASSEMLYDEAGQNDNKNAYFMSFLIAESNVKIYEYNRLVKDLNHLTTADFLDKIKIDFDVFPNGDQILEPANKHEFGMYLDGTYYLLSLKKEHRNFSSPLESLDSQILFVKVLAPIFSITDLRNDDRIEYLSGKHPLPEIKNLVDEGDFRIAFILFPSDIAEIKAIADAHLIMPPKSTYIEPKFRSGLVVYEL